jgi:hypothetical protein
MDGKKRTMQNNPGGFGGAYFLGMIGSAVYWIQVADGFWSVIWALIKALVWPGFLVYDVLKYIG